MGNNNVKLNENKTFIQLKGRKYVANHTIIVNLKKAINSIKSNKLRKIDMERLSEYANSLPTMYKYILYKKYDVYGFRCNDKTYYLSFNDVNDVEKYVLHKELNFRPKDYLVYYQNFKIVY